MAVPTQKISMTLIEEIKVDSHIMDFINIRCLKIQLLENTHYK